MSEWEVRWWSKRKAYLNFIIFADWQAAHVVFSPHFFGERRAHNFPPDVRGGLEVPLPLNPPGG